MELKNFVGQVVISTASKRRFLIYQITAPEIKVVSEKPDESGHYDFYVHPTINGDPISTGKLVFENAALNEPFKTSFDAYSRTEDAYYEQMHYWMYRS